MDGDLRVSRGKFEFTALGVSILLEAECEVGEVEVGEIELEGELRDEDDVERGTKLVSSSTARFH